MMDDLYRKGMTTLAVCAPIILTKCQPWETLDTCLRQWDLEEDTDL